MNPRLNRKTPKVFAMPVTAKWGTARRILAVVVAVSLGTALAGCAHRGILMQRPGEKSRRVEDDLQALPQALTEYYVNPLDVLSISVTPAKDLDKPFRIDTDNLLAVRFFYGTGEYHVMAGDLVRVNFLADPNLDFEAVIRPDGRVTLPRLGEVTAQGKTPLDLSKEISDAYKVLMNNPQTTVSVVQSNVALVESLSGEYRVRPDGKISLPILGEFQAVGQAPADLARAVAQAAVARFDNPIEASVIVSDFAPERLLRIDRQAVVASDGTIMLPDVGIIQVGGMTLPVLRDELRKAIEAKYSNAVDVTLTLVSSATRSVTVGGCVTVPGSYPIGTRTTMLQAVMVAGGVTIEGNLNEVVLIHHSGPGEITVYKTNLDEVIKKGKGTQDLVLAPQDIIYVPRTDVAEANKFVLQYIDQMLPFVRSVNYSFTAPTKSTVRVTQ